MPGQAARKGKKPVTWEDALEDHLPEDAKVTVAKGKKMLLLLPVDIAVEAAKKAGIKFEPPKPSAGYGSEEYKRLQLEREARCKSMRAVAAAAHAELLKNVSLPQYAEHVHDHAYAAAIYEPGNGKEWKTALAAVRKMSPAELAVALFMNEFMDAGRYVDYQGQFNDDFINLCKNLGVDLRAIQKSLAAKPQSHAAAPNQ